MATLNKSINAFTFLEILIYEKMHILELGKFFLVLVSLQKNLAVPEDVRCLPLAPCPHHTEVGSTG